MKISRWRPTKVLHWKKPRFQNMTLPARWSRAIRPIPKRKSNSKAHLTRSFKSRPPLVLPLAFSSSCRSPWTVTAFLKENDLFWLRFHNNYSYTARHGTRSWKATRHVLGATWYPQVLALFIASISFPLVFDHDQYNIQLEVDHRNCAYKCELPSLGYLKYIA